MKKEKITVFSTTNTIQHFEVYFFSWIYLFICFLFSLRASIDVEIKPFEKIIGLDCRGQLWQAAGYGGIKTQVKCNQESIIGICFSSIGKYVFFCMGNYWYIIHD